MWSKFKSLFLLLLCFSNAAHAFSKCCDNPINENATPHVRNIVTNEEGVLLQVEDKWIIAEALQATTDGIAILVGETWLTLTETLGDSDCARATWKCRVCGYNNYEGVLVCGLCGTPRPSS